MGPFSKMKILIILIVIVFVGAAFYAIVDGITSTVEKFVNGIAAAATAGKDWLREVFGISTVRNGMHIYPLTNDQAIALKEEIEAEGIDTDKAGITEVMIKKMILAQAVTSYTSDTICVAEVTTEEILKRTGYTDLNTYLGTCTQKNSDDVWPIDDYDYTLYYITDRYYYFKDEDDMVGKGADKYYLSIQGSITIEAADGNPLQHTPQTNFTELKNAYLRLDNDQKSGSQAEYDLLHYYTINNTGEMIVYKIIENVTDYNYLFKDSDTGVEVPDVRHDPNSTYEVIEVPIDIQASVDTSKYTVSIQLLMDLLDISASGQFVDEFIDYALSQSGIKVKAYETVEEQISYTKDTYNVKTPFIFELYDIIDFYDFGHDNMRAYKEIIYNRKYEGNHFDGSVVDLPDFGSIDNGTAFIIGAFNRIAGWLDVEPENLRQWFEDNGYDTQEKIEEYVDEKFAICSEETRADIVDYIINDTVVEVEGLDYYLLCAYDPPSGTVGNILVEETKITSMYETSWKFCIDSVTTWYGEVSFDDAIQNEEYFIDSVTATAEEYINCNENSLTNYTDIGGQDEITKIYISKDHANQVGIKESTDENVTEIEKDNGDDEDIYNEILEKAVRRYC